MTNFQFISLLSTAIGSFVLVILAWLHQNQRLTDQRVDTQRQFGDMQRQFGEVQRQFGDMQRLFGEVKSALATLSADYQNFYGLEQKLEGRVDELSKRVK